MAKGCRFGSEPEEIQETWARTQEAPTEDTLRPETSTCVDKATAPGEKQKNGCPPGYPTLKGLVHGHVRIVVRFRLLRSFAMVKTDSAD